MPSSAFLSAILKQNLSLSRKNIPYIFLICCIFLGNSLIACALPRTINLLGLENQNGFFPLLLAISSAFALLVFCLFCLFLRKFLALFSLTLAAISALYFGISNFFTVQGSDHLFLEKHLYIFGYKLPPRFFILFLILFGTILVIDLFLPSSHPEESPRKPPLALPFAVLLLTLLAAQSYRFRHHEINHFITENTGPIASLAGKDGQLRFLYPRPYQDIAQWKTIPGATLQTEHAGQRTALLLRRAFPGLLGDLSGFLLIQLTPSNQTLFEKTHQSDYE